MIIINVLRGGLGNQLFQWAITKQIESKHECEVLLDISSIVKEQKGITKRNFEINQFPNLKYKILNDENFKDYLKKPTKEFYEGNFSFDNLHLNNETNYYFNGYWQSFELVDRVSEIIKKELSCPEEKINNFYIKYPSLKNNTVSLHVRRTDYLTSGGFHPTLPIDYYERALNIIGDYDNIFIFSDDINWCKQNLNFKNQIFVDGQTSSEDIWLMSLCKNNIIANSTFSWWGAYLNKNTNNKVISPTTWFSTGDVPWIHSPKWIKI